MEHDFNGHEVNGIPGVYGKECYCRAFHLVNKLHDFNGMHDLSGNFCYDDFFRKTHARRTFELKVVVNYLDMPTTTLNVKRMTI